MKKKGRKGKGFGRLFAGPDESVRASLRDRSATGPEYDPEELETPEDILAKYGKYLDEDGVPFKGINPKPKYYVVPKETAEDELSVTRQPTIVHQILTEPAPRAPKKATVKKVRKTAPKKVVGKKRARPEPVPKKVTVRKVRTASVAPEPETTTKTVKIKIKSKS